VNIRAWSIGVYDRSDLVVVGVMNERVRSRQAWGLLGGGLMGNGATHELGLIDHGREDEFWTSDAFVECSAVEFLVWGRGGIG